MTTTKQPGKAEETRSRILNAALELFRRKGFEQATMREIAAEAHVALGNAYYYFDSKEALVMAFYQRASDEMAPRIETLLAEVRGFEKRLGAIITVKFQYFEPNRTFLGALLRHAADPQHPLSPFSDETGPIRERDIEFFGRALEDTRLDMPKDLAPHLPRLLWLYQMGLILFWIYDRSTGQRRTQLLREKSLDLLASSLKLLSLSLLRPVRKRIVELVEVVEATQKERVETDA
jgi:AcrR family transcriptional regulator